MKFPVLRFLIPLFLFILIIITHSMSPVVTNGDSRWTIPVALSILNNHTTDLDQYPDLISRSHSYAIKKINGHQYCFFPLGPKLFTVPVVAILKLWRTDHEILEERGLIEKISASIIVATAAIFIYSIANMFLNTYLSVLLTFIFAFCTPEWSTCSRAMWQHGPSVLMLTIALYVLLKAQRRPLLSQFASLPLAFSFVMRPTNSISILFLSIYVLMQFRKYFVKYMFWGAFVATAFILFNFSVYQSPLPPYYWAGRLNVDNLSLNVLLANLLSPGRGLFVFTPVFILSILGMILSLRKSPINKLDLFLIVIIVCHWLVISSFSHWWAGWSIGPRFFSDMTPYFIYLMIPFFDWLSGLSNPRKRLVWILSGILIGLSFFVHFQGAINPSVNGWNAQPVDIDKASWRVWDWKDPQFLRGLKCQP